MNLLNNAKNLKIVRLNAWNLREDHVEILKPIILKAEVISFFFVCSINCPTFEPLPSNLQETLLPQGNHVSWTGFVPF